ncbi:[bacterium]|nr:[FeFe] hydrogenase H-cluster radical SAM maturase HydE [bacterium]
MNILEKAKKYHSLEKEEIVALLKSSDKSLFIGADEVREKYKGNEVHLRGLIEFSNICKRTCKYCGLRGENLKLERYRLSCNEIVDFAKKGASYGYKTVVLQSGEDNHFSCDDICKIVREIKNLNIAVTLSLGEKTYEEYQAYKLAGADRYLLRIETTDENLYKELHPKMSLENRKQCLDNLKKIGYETGSGCLVGLPGQTIESLADDILYFKNKDFDMIGVGPFIPNPNTPLANYEGGDFWLAIRVMAIIRLLLPDINIPATTAMETLNPNGRIIALQSGANVVMPNITEGDYRRKYEIYPGKICVGDTPKHCRQCISSKILSIGRTISNSYGFRSD